MTAQLLGPAAGLACLIGPPHSGVTQVAEDLGLDNDETSAGAWPVRMAGVRPSGSWSTVGVLPGVPAVETELRILTAATGTCGIPFGVVELIADDLELVDRAHRHRRRPDGDHLHEGEAGSRSPGWPAPQLSAFLADLHRYRQRRFGLRTTAARLDVPWICVPSVIDREARTTAVTEAVERLTRSFSSRR